MSRALEALKQRRAVTWIMDSGFDDVAVWRTIWEHKEHLVCRLKHQERLIEYQDDRGEWIEEDIQGARQRLKLMATAETVYPFVAPSVRPSMK